MSRTKVVHITADPSLLRTRWLYISLSEHRYCECIVFCADVDRCGKKALPLMPERKKHATFFLHLVLRRQANINLVEASSIFIIVLSTCSDATCFSFNKCIFFLLSDKPSATRNKQCCIFSLIYCLCLTECAHNYTQTHNILQTHTHTHWPGRVRARCALRYRST